MDPDQSAAPNDRACAICAIIRRIEQGRFPDVVAELRHSWVILGDAQFYRGYCALLAKRHVTEIYAMARAEAHGLFDEIIAVGAAVANAVKPSRLNYECLGNEQPHLHWHVFPRYANDPMRSAPVWLRAENERKVPLEAGDRSNLIKVLRAELGRLVSYVRLE